MEHPTSDQQPVQEQQAPHGAEPEDSATRLRHELDEAQGRALRAAAELENFRKRMRRDMEDQQRYAAMPLLKSLLPVIDDVDRALAAAEKSTEPTALLDGIKMMRNKLGSVLSEHGVKKVEAQGAPFDPAFHEAIMEQPSAEQAPGTVLHVAQDGYTLHDRLIRPAQVIVAKGLNA